MNDWWNDPPDDMPEFPLCPRCGEDVTDIITVYAANGDDGDMFECGACKHRWPVLVDPDPGPEDYL